MQTQTKPPTVIRWALYRALVNRNILTWITPYYGETPRTPADSSDDPAMVQWQRVGKIVYSPDAPAETDPRWFAE